ncbi:MAG: metallophosphoesterase family protein [Ginsengibacter sp.]
MERIFAIGDIHGCSDALEQMLFTEIKIKKQDMVYCIGDYIDRGHDSKGVADIIISLQEKGYDIHTLRGNHEQMMLESEQSIENFDLWYRNGGNTTLQSFDVDAYSAMPEKYRRFFENTKYYISTNDYIFVHAGLNFNHKDIFEDKDAMLWTRDIEPYENALGNKILVHGHTPRSLHHIIHQKGNCINIDGGCVYHEHRHLGNLISISLPGKEFIVVRNEKQV